MKFRKKRRIKWRENEKWNEGETKKERKKVE